MPQAAVAVVGAAAATWLPAGGSAIVIGAGAAAIELSLFSSFLIRTAIGVALNALTPSTGLNQGTIVTGTGAAVDRQIIYGRQRVGGFRVFDHTRGEDNKYLHRVVVFSGHEVKAFDEVWLDDYKLTLDSAEYNNYKVTKGTKVNGATTDRFNDTLFDFRFGTENQTTFFNLANFTTKWTSEHRLRGCSAIHVRFEYDKDGENFPNGVPNLSATIKGKKLYDPRDGSHNFNDPGTWEWSDNPALCLLDYLISDYGLNEVEDNIDIESFKTAANICDELVDNLPRYTCNGTVLTSSTPIDIITSLTGSMAGMIWYSQGKWRTKAGAWVSPTLSLDESNLRGPISLSTRHSRRDNFNTVGGIFKGEQTDWQLTDYPSVTNQDLIDVDGGDESKVDVHLSFTDTSKMCRRIARILLEQNRQQLGFSARFDLSAMKAQVGDVVYISNDRFGWTDKEFEVISWTFDISPAEGLTVLLSFRETAESIYDEVNDGIVYEKDNTDLASPFFVPDVGITLSSELKEFREKVVNEVTVAVTATETYDVDHVEVQYKKAVDTNYISLGIGDLGRFLIQDLEDGSYDTRARAINSLGVKGDWAYASITLDAISQPPADVEGFTAEVVGAALILSWKPVTDIDLSHYIIRFSPATFGATWSNSITYAEKVSRPSSDLTVPARSGTFMIMSVDKSNILSENYTSVVVNNADLEQFTTTLTQTEDPTFTGTKNGCAVVSNELRIADYDTFDSLSGNLDDLVGFWDDLGAAYTGDSATYDFSNYIDVGSVKRCRVRVDAYSDRFDASGSSFDDIQGNLDQSAGLWDALTQNPQFNDTNTVSYVSTTDDDPSGTPTWSPYTIVRVADISARAFRFRVALLSDSQAITPSIGQLEAVVQHN